MLVTRITPPVLSIEVSHPSLSGSGRWRECYSMKSQCEVQEYLEKGLELKGKFSTWKGTVSKWVSSVFKKRVKHFCQEMRIVVGNKEWFNNKAKRLDLWLMRWADFSLTGRQGGRWNIRVNNTHGHLKKGFNSPCMTLHYYSVATWQINTN